MKKILLASAAALFCLSAAASASALIDLNTLKLNTISGHIQLAKNGSDDGADHDSGDDHGGSGGHSGSSGHGGSSGNSGHGSGHSDDDSDDDNSGSGRSKPRVPGGSGCDGAGDVAEHSECSGTAG